MTAIIPIGIIGFVLASLMGILGVFPVPGVSAEEPPVNEEGEVLVESAAEGVAGMLLTAYTGLIQEMVDIQKDPDFLRADARLLELTEYAGVAAEKFSQLQDDLGTKQQELDNDGDGLINGVEDPNENGVVDPGETDPFNPDSDDDGLLDGVEDANGNGAVDPGETDPLDPDSDDDGLFDGVEDANGNGMIDSTETDPLNPDTDGDGLFDGVEDANGNGLVDPGETDPLNPEA